MTGQTWIAVAVAATSYVLLVTERVHRVAAVLGGSAILLIFGLTDVQHAFYSESTGIDWNVIMLILGMMITVNVVKRTGVFEWIASWAADRTSNHPVRLLVLFCLITAIASALLDNVTTLLLVAPITVTACRLNSVRVAPILISEAIASNIGGAATLVGDPPNIIIGSRANISFNAFLTNLAPAVLVSLAVAILVLCILAWPNLHAHPDQEVPEIEVGIRDARLLIISLVVLAAILAGFLFQGVFGIEPSIVAIVGGLLLLSVSGLPVREILAEVDWTTLAFFSGLFILVGTLAKTGAITTVSSNLVGFVGDSQSLSFVTVLSGSAAISSFVDNVPYVAAATPVVAHLTAAHPEHGHLLWWALSIGANLGGNATSIGASANIVAVGLAERAGERISFLHFAKYGVIVTLASLSSAAAVLWFGRS